MKKYIIGTLIVLISSAYALADSASLSTLPQYQCKLVHVSGDDELTNVFKAENAGAAVLHYVTNYLVPTDIGYVLKDQANTFNSADPEQENTVITNIICEQVK